MKTQLKWIFAAALPALALLQLTNPARTNPPVANDFLAALAPPADLAGRFRSACYDCHSHETRWPWYSHIAPVSWVIAGDVNQARARLNLSTWPTNDAGRAAGKLQLMSDDVRSGEMPLHKYSVIHPDARLTPSQRDALANWLASQATRISKPPAPPAASSSSLVGSATPPPGRALFLKNCALCHGADARGDEGPDLHQLDWTDEQIANRIRDGKKGQMTAFGGKLTPDEITALVRYLRTL